MELTMTSVGQDKRFTPDATGFWSYKAPEIAISKSTVDTMAQSLEAVLPKTNICLTDHGKLIGPEVVATSSSINPSRSHLSSPNEMATKHTQYDNLHYRIAQPFPDASNITGYKPPHQFYISNTSTYSHPYSNGKINKNLMSSGRSPISDKESQEFSALDGLDRNTEIYHNEEPDYKLQRPSSL